MATGIKFNCKRQFFDRAAVLKSMDSATARVLGYAGGLTRKIARQSLRKRKKPSEPGKPPSSHTGLLRDNINYYYDEKRKAVIIGPRKLNQVDLFNGKSASGTIPQILEEGGRLGVLEQQLGTSWYRVDRRRKQNSNPKRIRTVGIEPRPYMAPALDKARPGFASKWKDSIK